MKTSAAILFTAGVLMLVSAAQPSSAAPRLGVVDMGRVFQDYRKKGDLERDLQKIKDELETKLAALKKKIEPLARELELLAKGTDRYLEIEKEIFRLTQESNFEASRAEEEFTRRKRTSHDQLIADIHATIAEYGKTHGFGMILQREFTLPQEALADSWRSVLYYPPEADLTAAITEILNR